MGVGSGARVENADVLGLGGRALLSAESGGSGLGGGLDGPVTEQDVEIDWQLAGRRTGSRSDYGALAACPHFSAPVAIVLAWFPARALLHLLLEPL